MRILLLLAFAMTLAACGDSDEEAPAAAETSSPLQGTLPRLNGEPDDLARYRGRPVLIVNTATECGFTPQFEGLQRLYERHRADGLVVLGFPSNDFANQEPRDNAEIADFCKANFGVGFPMFSKVKVTGEDAVPLFRALGEPDWNFNKYLLGRDGRLVRRWGATTEPDDPELVGAIRAQL